MITLNEAIKAVREGPLSILPDRDQDKIINLLGWVAQDSYELGLKAGMAATKKRKPYKATRKESA